jgi:hypothetical protein
MLRSIHAAGLATLTVVACAQTSQPPTTTAPIVSASATPDPTVAPSASAATPAPVPAPAASAAMGLPAGDASTGDDAQFRACKADADCIAVPRPGCCNNGWKEAVAASQKDAYAQANACTRQHPICPMFRVRDQRVAYCEPQTHLCTMKQP